MSDTLTSLLGKDALGNTKYISVNDILILAAGVDITVNGTIEATNITGTNTGDQTASDIETDHSATTVQDKIDQFDGYLDQAVKTTSDPTFNDVTVDKLQIKETAYFDGEVDNGNSGAADTIDWRVGNKQKSTLSEEATITFTAPAGPCNLILKCVNYGAFAVTFSPVPKWPSGAEPSWTASGTDILALYYDGSAYYGMATLDMS